MQCRYEILGVYFWPDLPNKRKAREIVRDSVSICAAESRSLRAHVEKIRCFFSCILKVFLAYLLALMMRVGEGVVVMVGEGLVTGFYTNAISPLVTLSLCNSRWASELEEEDVRSGEPVESIAGRATSVEDSLYHQIHPLAV